MQRHCSQSKERRGQIEPQKITYADHRHHSPAEVTGVRAGNEPLQTSTSSIFARNWKPKRRRRSGERLPGYCPRNTQNWLHLLKNLRAKSTFDHSYLALLSVLSNLPTAKLARPGPRSVPAPKGFARGWLFPGASRTSSCSIHATTRSRALRQRNSFYIGRKCRFKFTSKRVEF